MREVKEFLNGKGENKPRKFGRGVSIFLVNQEKQLNHEDGFGLHSNSREDKDIEQ